MNLSTNGWNALVQAQPIDPLSVISSCAIGSIPGVWERSTNFLQATWGFGNQEIYGEAASGRVVLAPFNGNDYTYPYNTGRAYMAWAGTDMGHTLNIMQVI